MKVTSHKNENSIRKFAHNTLTVKHCKVIKGGIKRPKQGNAVRVTL